MAATSATTIMTTRCSEQGDPEAATAAAAAALTAAAAAAAAAKAAATLPPPRPLIRRLEKRFQRHLTNSRRRPRELPADLTTGVVDCTTLLGAAAAPAPSSPYSGGDPAATAAALVPLPMPPTEQRAYAVRGHPGLVLFPAAVPPGTQRRLLADALARWPEPPLGRTNLHAQYPGGLHGLLGAAAAATGAVESGPAAAAVLRQAAAVLGGQRHGRRRENDDDDKAAGGSINTTTPQLTCARRPRRQRQARGRGAEEEEEEAYGGEAAADDNAAAADDGILGPHSPRPDPATGNPCTRCWAAAEAMRDSSEDRDVAAAAGGGGAEAATTTPSGPSAPAALRSLRWATLGPPYDWTRRVYEPEAPHLPLPQELTDLAARFAQAAAAGLDAAAAAEGGGCGKAKDEAAAFGRAVEGFSPDAALVNYYREGDTLFAHVDESEAGFGRAEHKGKEGEGKEEEEQEREEGGAPAHHHHPPPLVTVSLGAAAIFLVGGPERHSEPVTPLLLRSGDVVVLCGPARRAHHGVPRVFGGARALVPAEVAAAAEAGEGGAAAAADALAVFSSVRVNISIRQALERRGGR
jgi:alkylated DNA repair dioxygenase AlkB